MTLYNNKTNGKLCVRKKDAMMWLFLVMLTLPHMNPPYLSQLSVWESVLNGWRMVSFLLVVFWFFIVKKRVSQIVILICAWEIFLFITTFLHQGEIYSSAVSAFSILSIVLLYDVAYDKGKLFLSSQLFCFEIIVYINLLTELLYPNGLYIPSANSNAFVGRLYWFLGYYNNHTKYFIPALLFAWLYYQSTKLKKRTFFLTIAIYISAFLAWSGGVLISLSIIAVVFVFFKNRTFFFNYYTYWMLHIVFYLFVIVFKMQNLFKWIINDFLGKWNSLMGRMIVWERTLKFIKDSPFIGHGIQNSFVRASEYNVYWASTHAHNMLLEVLYQGGAIGISLWISIVILAGKRIFVYRNTEESKIISLAFLGWCVSTLVEPFTTSFLMAMFVVAYLSNSSK